mgnify:CR=1 FL=1
MKKNLLKFVLVIFASFNLHAQEKVVWNSIEEKSIENQPKVKRASFPQEYQLWKLDLQSLKTQFSLHY